MEIQTTAWVFAASVFWCCMYKAITIVTGVTLI